MVGFYFRSFVFFSYTVSKTLRLVRRQYGVKMIKLSNAAEGIPCVIKELSLPQETEIRLCELGFIPQTEITPIFVAPSGEPRAYFLRGTQLALRRELTDNILVSQYMGENE